MDVTDVMSDVQIDLNNICSICKNTTYEKIENICSRNCKYVCHKSCLKQWVTYRVNKKEDVHCPYCINNYSVNVVNTILELS